MSRANPRDNSRHVVLSTTTVRPGEFAGQLNVQLQNGWGIVRTIVDLCMKHQDGKYILIKDPNKVRIIPPTLCLYDLSPIDSPLFVCTLYQRMHSPKKRTSKTMVGSKKRRNERLSGSLCSICSSRSELSNQPFYCCLYTRTVSPRI